MNRNIAPTKETSMHRRLATLIFALLVLSALMPAAIVAQDSRLNGVWIAPITMGTGPRFFAFTFHVNGNTVTGSMSDTGGAPLPITNGKIDNGQLSFALATGDTTQRAFTGTLGIIRGAKGAVKNDDKRLELVQENRTFGFKLDRAPGSKSASNSLEGEWGASVQTWVFHVNGDKLTGEVTDRAHLTQYGKEITHEDLHLPLLDGTVHGNAFSFRYINKWNDEMHTTGTLVGGQLVMDSIVKHTLRVVRVADAPVEPKQ
jgi:hypothetical protein